MKFILKSVVVSVLTFEAKLLLRRAKPKIIAITGSVGKTTTKDAIYAALKDRHVVRKSEKSYNSEIGVPLTVLGLENAWSSPVGWIKNMVDGLMLALMPHEYPEILVLEMGVDRPGDMKRFAKWIKPDVVVLTRLPDVPVHVEYFASPEAVVEEKLELVKALKPDGVFVYNNDDEAIRRALEDIRQRSIGYSRYSPTDFAATQDVVRYEGAMPIGMSFTLTHLHEEAVTIELDGCIGVQHTYSAAAAAAVGSLFDIELPEIAAALKHAVVAPGRMRIIPGIKNTIILDDSYNASPVAVERALLTLKEVRSKTRKIAVIGDMLELGRYSIDAHKEVGRHAASCADLLITVGVRARGVAEGALANGLGEAKIFQYDEVDRAGRELQNLMQKGDVILVKGSQGIRLEKLIEEVMLEPEDAEKLLVRQSKAWK